MAPRHARRMGSHSRRSPCPPHSERQIKAHNKVRTGCKQCKSRRVKCDETRPHCQRCIGKRLSCEYVPLKTWLFDPVGDIQSDDGRMGAPTNSSLAMIHMVTDRDFQFFIEVTGPLLSSYHAEMGLRVYDNPMEIDHMISTGYAFHHNLLPQLVQSRPVLKYAIGSLATCHESIELAGKTAWENSAFSRNYFKALESITKGGKNVPVEEILVSCICFAHIDFMHGRAIQGVRHIVAGAKIIDEFEKDPKSDSYLVSLIRDMIKPFYACYLRFAGQALPPESRQGSTSGDSDDEVAVRRGSRPLLTFNSITEARHDFFRVASLIMPYSNITPSNAPFECLQARTSLLQWANAYQAWKASRKTPTSLDENKCEVLLDVHAKIVTLWASRPTDNEMTYDRFFQEFQSIVDTVEALVTLGVVVEDFTRLNNPTFLFSLGFIFPLFFVVVKCRAHKIRQRALELLRTMNINEGLWNSCLAYGIAKKVVEIEDPPASSSPSSTSSSSAPPSLRFTQTDVTPPYRRMKLYGIHPDPQSPWTVLLQYHASPFRTHSSLLRTVPLLRTPCQYSSQQAAVHLSATLQNTGYQGLVRSISGRCTCAGAGIDPECFSVESPGALILAGRLPNISRCLAGWGIHEITPVMHAALKRSKSQSTTGKDLDYKVETIASSNSDSSPLAIAEDQPDQDGQNHDRNPEIQKLTHRVPRNIDTESSQPQSQSQHWPSQVPTRKSVPGPGPDSDVAPFPPPEGQEVELQWVHDRALKALVATEAAEVERALGYAQTPPDQRRLPDPELRSLKYDDGGASALERLQELLA